MADLKFPKNGAKIPKKFVAIGTLNSASAVTVFLNQYGEHANSEFQAEKYIYPRKGLWMARFKELTVDARYLLRVYDEKGNLTASASDLIAVQTGAGPDILFPVGESVCKEFACYGTPEDTKSATVICDGVTYDGEKEDIGGGMFAYSFDTGDCTGTATLTVTDSSGSPTTITITIDDC